MCRHRIRMALAIGGSLLAGAGAANAELDLSLRGDADASFSGEATGDSLGGLSFDLEGDPAAVFESDGGEVAGGLDSRFGGGAGHDVRGFGGGEGALPGTEGRLAPTPTAALLGAAGLAGLGVSRRRR